MFRTIGQSNLKRKQEFLESRTVVLDIDLDKIADQENEFKIFLFLLGICLCIL